MAFTAVRAHAKHESQTSAVSTMTFSPDVDIEVGDTVVMDYDTNVVHSVSSCADNSSQAGTANAYVIRAARTGTVASFGWVYCLKVTRKILTTDVITITFSAASTRRAGHMLAVIAGNGNPRFESQVGITNDTASPVPMGATGTLYTADTFAICGWGWKGGAVASGFAQTVPALGGGWVTHADGVAASGGTSTRVETNTTYNLDTNATTTFTPNSTYTSVSVVHGECLLFSDEPIDGRVPQVRSVGAAGGGAFGAGITANLPNFPQPDDLMLFFVTLEESATLGTNPPSGWTAIGSPVSVAGGGILYAFWRKWVLNDVAPTITWTPTTDGGNTQMVCIHCDTWDETTPFEIYHTASEATVDTSWSYAPGTSTTGPNRLCWAMYTSGFDAATGQGSSTATNASLTGIVGRINASTAGGLGAGFTGATGIKATAGTVGTWAATLLNASAKAYHSFAIRPAVVGGPVQLTFASAGAGTTSFTLGRRRPLAFDERAVGGAILDSFNAGATQALTARAGWGSTHWSGTLDLQTDAGPTYASTALGVPAGNIWATNFGTDHEAMFTFGSVIGTMQLLGRVNSATGAVTAGYVGYVASGNQEIQTRAGATLASGSTITPAAGDSFRLRCIGTSIYLDYRPSGGSWSNILSCVDSTYTTGTFIGIHTTSAGSPRIDEFGGGTVNLGTGGVGTTTFNLMRYRGLAFTSTGAGTTAFALTARRALAFASPGVGTSAFALRARRALAFTSTGVGTSTFALRARRALAFASTGVGTSAFALTKIAGVQLTFTSTGVGTSAFALRARRALAMTSTGTGTSTFALTARRALAMTSTGVGTSAFALTRKRALTFTSTGTGTTSFALRARRALAMTSTGVGTSAFALRAKRALAFTSTGTGTSSFVLTSPAPQRQLTFDERAVLGGAILDSFNAGATQALSARSGWAAGHWTGTLDLRTDAVPTKATTALGTPANNIWAANFGTDHESMFTYAAGLGTTHLLARVNSTTAPSQGYVGHIAAGNQEIQTRAGATLASGSTITPAAGDSFRLRCVGSLITLDYRPAAGSWSNILSVTDTTYTTGTFIGIHAPSGTPEYDEFGGGAVSLGTGGVGTTSFNLHAKRALAFTSTGAGTSTFTLGVLAPPYRQLYFDERGDPLGLPDDLETPDVVGYPDAPTGGVGTSTFNLHARRALTFTSTGTGTTTFALRARRALAMTSTGVGTTTFNLRARRALAFTSPGVGTSAFAIHARRALAMTSTGVGTTTFALRARRALAMTSAGVGTSSFVLTTTSATFRQLTFASPGVGTTSFTLHARRALTLTSAGVGTSSFALRARRALAFTSTGAGTSSFVLRAGRALAFASPGVGTTSFALTGKRGLAFTSTGVGTTTFALVVAATLLQGVWSNVTVTSHSALLVQLSRHAMLATTVDRPPSLAAGTSRRADLAGDVDAAGNLHASVS